MTILKDAREIASMQTVADGRFAFILLEAGKYDIRIQAKAFLSAFSSIALLKPSWACKKELGVLLVVGMGW